METDSWFEICHPLVPFLFFLGAVVAAMFFSHPLFLLVSCTCSLIYLGMLGGRRGLRLGLSLLVAAVVIAFLNALFNARGNTVLFYFAGGRPFTLESLLYGFSAGGMFFTVVAWFACMNHVMTSDHYFYLFSRLAPALSMIFCMVMRFVPLYQRKAASLKGARQGIGKYGGNKPKGKPMGKPKGKPRSRREKGPNDRRQESLKEGLKAGMGILYGLTGWALENSVSLTKSMQSRGYGSGRRSTFGLYRFRRKDAAVLSVMAALAAGLIICACLGGMEAAFLPNIKMSWPGAWHGQAALFGLIFYAMYLLIPVTLQIEENLSWHISRSSI